MKKKMMSVASAARILNVSQTTIRRLIRDLKIQSVKLRRTVRIPAKEIEQIVGGMK